MQSDMKKLPRYNTAEDIKMRLNESILLYKGSPVYVETNGMKLHLSDYASGVQYANISPEDPNLSLCSPPLGYTNDFHIAYYLSRYPLRKQKQGIDAQCIRQITEKKEGPYFRHGLSIPFTSVADAIFGKFSDLNTVVQYLNGLDRAVSRAFHRKFCLVKTDDPNVFQISHAGNRIGLYSSADNLGVIKRVYSGSIIPDVLYKFMNVTVQHDYEEVT